MPAPSEVQKYLSCILSLNPFHDSEKIIALRASFLGLKREHFADKATVRRSTEDVAAVQEILNLVRSNFWHASQEEMTEQLQSLDLGGKPELAAAVKRLTKVISLQTEFLKLSQKPFNYPPLLQIFKSIVVMPPNEAGLARERALQFLRVSGDLRKMRKMLREMRNQHSALYQLEADWFSNLDRIKKVPRAKESKLLSFAKGFLVWGVGILIVTGLATFSSFDSFNRKKKPKSNMSKYLNEKRNSSHKPVNE